MKLVLFAVVIVLLGQLSSAQIEKLTFGIFVRPSCGGCHTFVTEELYPNYNRFAKYIDLFFFPLKVEDDVDAEYLACATYETYDDRALQVDYFNCHFGGMGMKECAEKFGIDWNAIETCKENDGGKVATDAYREIVISLGIKHVPSIAVDEIYDETVSDHLVNNFVKTLCLILDNPADACGDVKKIQYVEI